MDSLITLKCSNGNFLVSKNQLIASSKYFDNQSKEFPEMNAFETKFLTEEWANLFDIMNSHLSEKYVPVKINPFRYTEMIAFYDFYNEKFFRSKLDSLALFTELKSHSYAFHMLRDEENKTWKSDHYTSKIGVGASFNVGTIHFANFTIDELKDKLRGCKVKYTTKVFYWNIEVPGTWYQLVNLCPDDEDLKKVYSSEISGEFLKEKWVDEVKNPEEYEEY